jgi:lysophospholipase L1-like esterase
MADVPPSPPPLIAPNPAGASVAAPRPWAQADWLAQHDGFVARAAQGGIDVLFLGDSITAFFPTRGAEVWNREIAPLGTIANFGISGDRTQFVLWRAQHGELDGSQARVVVIMAGTNNLASAAAPDIARGVAAIVAEVRARLPDAVGLLNAILPRGAPDDPLRAKLADVNARIATLADGDHVRWIDAGSGFVGLDGRIVDALMPDGLHPSAAGYDVWATFLRPAIAEALSNERRSAPSNGRSRYP